MHFFGNDALRNYRGASGPVGKGHSPENHSKKAMSILPSLPQPMDNLIPFVSGNPLIAHSDGEKEK